MKKRCLCLAVLPLILILFCICTAIAGNENDPSAIPDQIMEELIPYTNSGDYWIQTYDLMSGGEWAVATLQGTKGNNLLFLYQYRDQEWKLYTKSDSAIFQGKKLVSAGFEVSEQTYESGPKGMTFRVSTPVLSISQLNSDKDSEAEYPERVLNFTLQNGKWLLVYWEDFDYCSAFVQEDALYYYGSWLAEYEPWYGKVDGTIQRDIRWTSIANIPHDYKTAKKKVTVAPTIPDGDLNADNIKFTGGKKYAVYSAPDKSSVRSAKGEAAVSTNDWIQVFGQEDDWILIQYAIDKDHYRFGYIPSKALPKKTAVKELDFSRTVVRTQYAVPITDDPLFSCTELISLQRGEEVTLLATMGQWAYVEVEGQTKCRGFVPADCLVIGDENAHQYSVFTASDGTQYNMFSITKFLYGSDHKVMAVTGNYERSIFDGDCEAPETAQGSETTYELADDFHADMIKSVCADTMEYETVTDLHEWYTRAYLSDGLYEGGDLIFCVDVEDPDSDYFNFWFVTTQIELNKNGEIQYMQFVYTPWM